jgi:SpoVK/Ycf46/Vps4 family AAA+-type ATPase
MTRETGGPLILPEFHLGSDMSTGREFRLPVDAVTETLLIFGKKGSGKTTTAVVMAEEMIDAGLPVCVIDPMGAWWGLRSSADGQGPGLPVTILGGEHADLDLPPDAGGAVAHLVAAQRLPVVLDLFLLSKTKQRQFVTEFMEVLFRENRQPLHLVVDEADRWAPQRGTPDTGRLIGAYEDIVLRGRKPGIGSTSITLRPAALHSAIRSQVEALLAMRMLGKLDVDAIDEWIKLHATADEARELKASLPSLPTGIAWFWSPGWLEVLAKVQIRQRRTFDSSATPKVGEELILPEEFARLDAAGLERMAVLLQPAAAGAALNDPAALRARIAGLERDLRAARSGAVPAALTAENASLREQLTAALARPAERVEVPVVPPGDVAAFDQAVTAMRDTADRIELALRSAPRSAPPRRAPERPAAPPAPPRLPTVTPAPPAAGPEDTSTDGLVKLKAGARNMLGQLARNYPLQLTRTQLGALAGIRGSGSTFSSYLSSLRLAGFVAPEGNLVPITPEGLAEAGAAADQPPMTAEEIRAQWRRVLKAGARSMLDHLLTYYPEPVTRAELAALAGINPAGSTLTSYLSTLRTNNLIEETRDGITAAGVFFLEPAGV